MKNTFKLFLAACVLGIYFLIGTATSTDDGSPFFISGDIINTSDSCDINQINFLVSITPTRVDTIPIWFTPLLAGDTANITTDSLGYHTIHYICACDSLTEAREVPFNQGSSRTFPTVEIGCE